MALVITSHAGIERMRCNAIRIAGGVLQLGTDPAIDSIRR